MAEYRLYCYAESGNCYKAALMLALTGMNWVPQLVDPATGEARSEPFRATVNEFGEVPVLEHAGERLSQSGVILSYLAERSGRFGGRSAAEKYQILSWLLFDNHKFTSYFASLRFMLGVRKMSRSPVTEFLLEKVLSAFGIVEKHLATRAFIVGNEPTIADISMAGYLYYPEETGVDRGAFPNIDAWTQRIRSLPGWRHPYELMPRCG